MSNPEQRRILVVDDEPDITTIISMMLQNAGYGVITADNGLEAVKTVYNTDPDCIILDVMMPRMNGYQVCRLLKHDPKTRNIPIILCTVKSLEMDRLYGLTAGADYYLTKPFDPGDLLKLVNDALRKRPASEMRTFPILGEPASTDTILTEINLLLDLKLKEYTILQHVSRSIAGTLNLDDLLRIILRSTTTDLGFKRGYFLLISDDGTMGERFSTGEMNGRESWSGSLSDFPRLGAILERGAATVIPGTEAGGIIPEGIIADSRGAPMAVVPIIAKGKALGVILVDCTSTDGGCDEETLNFFLVLAGQAGLAIENAQLYAKTLRLSITDGLTGLYNYRYFMGRLEAEFTRAKRYARKLAFFILDIDHFKDFNDRFGHLKGDEALRHLGKVLRKNVREVDVLARYGGEEFAFIIPETDLEEAVVLAERIRKDVAQAGAATGGMTVSIGVAVVDERMANAEELIRKADEALYEAKGSGRNRVCSAV